MRIRQNEQPNEGYLKFIYIGLLIANEFEFSNERTEHCSRSTICTNEKLTSISSANSLERFHTKELSTGIRKAREASI